MDAGTDKRELAKIVVSYKGKLGPWSTTRLLQEYLKVGGHTGRQSSALSGSSMSRAGRQAQPEEGTLTSKLRLVCEQVVFRAPDLSPAFVEALDYVVTSLLRVKEDELFTYIAEVTKEVSRQAVAWGEGTPEAGLEPPRCPPLL